MQETEFCSMSIRIPRVVSLWPFCSDGHHGASSQSGQWSQVCHHSTLHLFCSVHRCRIFTYFGEEVGRESAEVLLEARWIPVEQGTFEDRPVSPNKRSARPAIHFRCGVDVEKRFLFSFPEGKTGRHNDGSLRTTASERKQ